MKEPKMANITVADLRNLKASKKKEHEWGMRLREEVRELSQTYSQATANREYIARTLDAEKTQLQARLLQIDLTLHLLGWKKA